MAGRVISESDYRLLQEMVTWWQRNKNNWPQFRRRNISVSEGLGSQVKIFEVQSEATGDGVYNCYEQTLDATEWDDTAGDPKFDNANTTSVEVLNLAEYNPESTYVAHLAAGDLIAAWQKMDDENNKRWEGVPFRQANADRSRRAYINANAGSGLTIACKLDSPAGTAITVYCDITQGGLDLDEAEPRLSTGGYMMVEKIGGVWRCTSCIFQPTVNCDCYEA